MDVSSTRTDAAPDRLDRSAREPLWLQLRDAIAARIEADEFGGPNGAEFPGELALVEHYGVSRHTVRLALRSLREAGIVSAERGRAPRLLRARVEQPLGTLYSLFASVESVGMQQVSVVRALDERVDAHIAVRLGLPDEEPLIFLHRLRLADGEPIALDRVWLPAALARPLLDADFGHTGLYAELDARCGIRPNAGTEEVDAVTLLRPQADVLKAPAGAPAFLIQRLTCANDRPVEWRTTLVRADRFRIRSNFSSLTGSRLVVPQVG